MSDTCYLCGATTELTREHLPPKGFFPRPLPQNLITVSCCRTCNHSWHLDDDAVRAFFSVAIGRSEAGESIWEERVIPGTVARSPAFREYMLERVQNVAVATPFGIESLPAFDPPHERIERFMVRLTKGFLRFYYPDYDYIPSKFTVRHIPSTEKNLQMLEDGLIGTRYDERGDGVVRYRFAISDTGNSGLWFYMFYDAVWILVHHVRSTSSAQHGEGGKASPATS
jgi:hypothetical protein